MGFVWAKRLLEETDQSDGRGESGAEQAECQPEVREPARLTRAIARQKEILATVAHELRSPVGCIQNAVQILRLVGGLDPRMTAAEDLIDRQVAHMTRLIEDLLDDVRLSEGNIVSRSETIDLGRIVRTSVEDNRVALHAAGVSLTLDLPGEPVWISGDSTRIHQILSNLLNNAVKFTESGGNVVVSLSETEGTRDAVVSIRDTGVGIDAETLGLLFEPFVQLERTRDRSRAGLGLGLSLVRGFARLHGGDVEAISPGLGRGSEFRVRLPLEQSMRGSRECAAYQTQNL